MSSKIRISKTAATEPAEVVTWDPQVKTLKLRGIVDIFEAGTLLEAARKALETQIVSVDFTAVERLDLSALQVLCVLRREMDAKGQACHFSGMPEALVQSCAAVGFSLV